MRTTLPITLTAFVLSLVAANHASAALIGVPARDSRPNNNLDAFGGNPAVVTITVGSSNDTGSEVTGYVDSQGNPVSDPSPMRSKLWIRETDLNQTGIVNIYWRNRAMVERAAEELGGGIPTTPPLPAGFNYLGSDVAKMGSLPQGYIVVEMSYKVDPSDEAVGGPLGHLYLGTLVGEGSARHWVNAADTSIDQSTNLLGPKNMSWIAFRESESNSGKTLSQLAGSWGYVNDGPIPDGNGIAGEGTVWAVLDNRATAAYPNGFYTDRQLSAVPEPGTITLLAASGMVLAVAGLKRRRNRKAAV